MQKYFNNVTNRVGDAIVGASVTVTLTETGALATLYSDNGVTPTANPLTTDNNGQFSFYAANGRYTLSIAGSGFSAYTISDVLLEDDTTSAAIDYTPAGAGAVERTVQSKLRETVSVLDFGATGDGSTNDTAAIQAAVTAAAGKRLYFPSGTYLTNKITLPSSSFLVGDGAGTTIKLRDGQDDHLLYASGQTGLTVRDMVLDGNKAAQTVGAVSRCFYAVDCSDVRLEGLTVKNASDHGAHISIGATSDPLSDSSRVWADRCKFLDNGTTVLGGNGGTGFAATCKYLWATDCYSEGNILSGFKFTGSYVTAKGCYAIDNDCGGFSTGFDSVSEEGTAHVYEGCYALNNGDGTNGGDGWRHQGQVDRIIHRDCFAIGNKWSGISLVATTTVKPTDIDIYGGAILNNGQSFTPAATVAGAGVSLLSTTTPPDVPSNVRLHGVTILDNQGVKTQTYGIEIQDGSDVYIGEGCRLNGNLTASMYNAATVTSNVRLSPAIIDADFIKRSTTAGSVTGTTSETDLQSLTIPANTLGIGQRFRVRARGLTSGTNGTKSIRLYFGNGNALASSQVAADQQEWFVDGVVEIAATGSQKVGANGYENGGQASIVMPSSSSNVNTALTCKVTGTLGNAADTITCSSFFFEPLF